jgi:hypothetical protein
VESDFGYETKTQTFFINSRVTYHLVWWHCLFSGPWNHSSWCLSLAWFSNEQCQHTWNNCTFGMTGYVKKSQGGMFCGSASKAAKGSASEILCSSQVEISNLF